LKNKVIWLGLSLLIVTTMLLASCNSSTTTSTPASTTSIVTTTSTTPTSIASTTSTTSQLTTTAVTTTSTGNWWDSLGTPQYGGKLTIRYSQNPTGFDPWGSDTLTTIMSAWMERLFTDNWTLNPSVYNFQTRFRPNQDETGCLAASWEFTDPTTFVIHLRQNVYWQNLPPANGRQFVASDIVAHYMRMYDPQKGTFTNLGGVHATSQNLLSLVSVTASDKFTVAFKWTTPNPEFIYETVMLSGNSENSIENPEAVTQYGNLNNWHNAVGTGPFILTDFVDSTSATLVNNPNYWGTDERYPQNKLPYINLVNFLIIPNASTALAAFRAGKIDDLDGMTLQAAQGMEQTNPEVIQQKVPASYALSIDPKHTVSPYTSIQVIEALQMTLNLPEIANTYYSGQVDPWPVSMTSNYLTGYNFPFSQWPASLQAQYAYNPTQAKQLLAQAGYPNGFNTDIVVDSGWDMSLLGIVQSEFAAINVNMSIKTMDNASWQGFVSSSHSQDALAANSAGGMVGRAVEPIVQLNKWLPTDAGNWTQIFDPVWNTFATQAAAATTVTQVQQIVQNANLYVAQNHFVISLLNPMGFNLVQPWLKGYSGQVNALSGNVGASYLFFYPARFWIVPH